MNRIVVLLAVALMSVTMFAMPASAQETAQAQIPGYGSGGNCAQYHIVNRGETLAMIARWYGTTWSYLASINGIANPNRIYPGQYLCVSLAPPPQTTYVVQRGDWLSLIAQRFGVSLNALMAANNIYNPNLIFPGQVLIITQPVMYGNGTSAPQPYMPDGMTQPIPVYPSGGVVNPPPPVYPSGGGVVNPPPPVMTPEPVG